MKLRFFSPFGFLATGIALMLAATAPVHAQTISAFDDEYSIPRGLPLVVEPFGVLDNDLLDDENAGETGAVAELVTDVQFGTLVLNADGSFNYSDGPGFDGHDSFVYRAVSGAASSVATVALTACEGGPDVFTCWNENEFLAKAAELGYYDFAEGFEDDAVWGASRSPYQVDAVVTQGVRWTSNHRYDPAWNMITTGTGPARSGVYGFFDVAHGYATGTSATCDVDMPPEGCLYHDGWTLERVAGESTLHGIGGWVTGGNGARVEMILDSAPGIGAGWISYEHQFFGAIDTRPAGITRFSLRETDGKVGQQRLIWADDFTFLTATPPVSVSEPRSANTRVFFAGAGPNPSNGTTSLHFTIADASDVLLEVFDQRGRLVRRLARTPLDAGRHAVSWDGRDRNGRIVSAGTYFGRLSVTGDGIPDVQVRKMIVTR